MKLIGFWLLPVFGVDIANLVSAQSHLTYAGSVAANLVTLSAAACLWVWCGRSLMREWRKKVVKTVTDDIFADSWTAKLEGETYIMLPPNEGLREKIRASNRLVMDIGKVSP